MKQKSKIRLASVEQPDAIDLRPFKPEDQDLVRNLILSGLKEHFGELDADCNLDLNDIQTSFAGATFIVAWLGERIVGCGALVPRSEKVAEVVRMSVACDLRRRGIGSTILRRLCDEARQKGYCQLILETTAAWKDVINFYRKLGFRITHYQTGKYGREVYFALKL